MRDAESVIRRILEQSRTIAVVGLSSRDWRPSHQIAKYLQEAGYRIIPVNPNETEVLGEKAYASLEDVQDAIDTVNIFRRSEYVLPVVESAVRVAAKAIWMQEGVIDQEAAQKARDAGLRVVMDCCILKATSAMGRREAAAWLIEG